MNKLFFKLLGAFLVMLTLYACTSEADFLASGDSQQGSSSLCTFTIPEVPVHEMNGCSRTAISIEDNALKFVWAVGDRIGILPTRGSQVYFTIDDEKAGGTRASFDGGSWALKPGHSYDAYFPFVPDIMLDRTAVPVDYTGQKQTGNNSMAHLGGKDYLAAKGTTNENGGVNYVFQRMGSVAILKFTVPNAGTELKSVTLTADEAVFTTKGTIDMDDETLAVEPTETSESLTIALEEIETTEANEEVTVYFMCYPDQLAEKQLNVSIAYGDADDTFDFVAVGKNMVAGNGYVLSAQPVAESVPYLTFSAGAEQTMMMAVYNGYVLDESLQYSVGDGAWTKLTAGTEIAFGGQGKDLRLRGQSSMGTAASNSKYSQITFGNYNPVSCTGDIRTLVDYTDYNNTSTVNARFCSLFCGCYQLTSAPELSSTTLATYCYDKMFAGCGCLTEAPALPATTLAMNCYSKMFESCSALKKAPVLPATTLANYCYYFMFNGCTGLTGAPALPATTLARDCYDLMFNDCTALTEAPALPADTLVGSCYSAMFQGCTSLTKAPELPATTLANRCYSSMFRGCTGLTEAPALPATILADHCYYNMFGGCTGLKKASSLPAETLAPWCYSCMFMSCTSLTDAPALPATILADYCYNSMFHLCTSLAEAPTLPATTLAISCYAYMFTKCPFTVAPVLPAMTLTGQCYRSMFSGCTNLNSVTILATDVSAEYCLEYWLDGVSATGTFTKAAEMTSLPEGSSGIPAGWTVVDYTTEQE